MPLLNVRLSADDARRAAELREEGIQISDVVREAIRAEYLRRRPGKPGNRRPSLIVKEILEALPDTADAPRSAVDPQTGTPFAVTSRRSSVAAGSDPYRHDAARGAL